MFDKAGIMMVNDISNVLTGMFMLKYHHKQLPYLFHDCLMYNYEIREYVTGNPYGIHVPKCRTLFGIRFRYL